MMNIRSTAAAVTAAIVSLVGAHAAVADPFERIEPHSFAPVERFLSEETLSLEFDWARECDNWKDEGEKPLPAGAAKYVCHLSRYPEFVVLFAQDGSSERAKLQNEIDNIGRIAGMGLKVVPTGTRVLTLPKLEGRETRHQDMVYGFVQAYADPDEFYFWHRVAFPGARKLDRLEDYVRTDLARGSRAEATFCEEVLDYQRKLDHVVIADEQGVVYKADGTLYFNDPYAVFINRGNDVFSPDWFDDVVPSRLSNDHWVERKRARGKNGLAGFGDPIGMRTDQLSALRRLEDVVCRLGLSDIRSPFRMPAEPITDVVLGEEVTRENPFSPGTAAYVKGRVDDIVTVPFAESVEAITLTTERRPSHVAPHRDMTNSILWRKPLDPRAGRRRPLTIYNYSDIALSADAKDLTLFGIPSRGLMLHFALVLKFFYKQVHHKDVIVSVEQHDKARPENDAAAANYTRLRAFFEEAMMGKWYRVRGGDVPPTFTLVFGYKKVIDRQWAAGATLLDDFTYAGWVGHLYQTKDREGLGTDYVVTLDSDTQSSYHVEVLGENIRQLTEAQVAIGIDVRHIIVAGSAGYIGNDGNGDPEIARTPAPNSFIFPSLLTYDHVRQDNRLADEMVKQRLIHPRTTEYVHTSVPTLMKESPALLRTLRAMGVSSIDMEFAYVRALVDLRIPVSPACLITDFPWTAPPEVRLAHKSAEDKERAEIAFALALGKAIRVLP